MRVWAWAWACVDDDITGDDGGGDDIIKNY